MIMSEKAFWDCLLCCDASLVISPCLCLFVSVCLCLSLSLSVCLSVYACLCLCLCQSLSVSIYLCLSVWLSCCICLAGDILLQNPAGKTGIVILYKQVIIQWMFYSCSYKFRNLLNSCWVITLYCWIIF